MRGGVLTVDVVGVVRRDHRDREVLADLEQPVPDPLLDRQVVVHQLDEVVLLAEDVLELGRRRTGLGVVADAQPRLDLTRRAARGADQARGVLAEQLAVGARLVVVALHAGPAGEPEQVVHARRALRQQRHVGVGAGPADVVVAAVVPPDALLLVAAGVGCEVGLHADDRLDPGCGGLAVEVVGPEHVAVVGHRDAAHAELRRTPEKVIQSGRTVEHGVLGVDVEVDEVPTLGRVGRHGRGGPPQRHERSGIRGRAGRHAAWTDQLGEERQTTRPPVGILAGRTDSTAYPSGRPSA